MLTAQLQLCTELLADHLLILLRHRCIAVQDLAAQHLHSFLELQRGLSFVPSDKKAVVYYVPGELVERLRDLVLQRWTLKEDEVSRHGAAQPTLSRNSLSNGRAATQFPPWPTMPRCAVLLCSNISRSYGPR